MINSSPELIDLVKQSSSRAVPRAVEALSECLLERFGSGVRAILFYGSCLRQGDDFDGLVDLYVLVDAYRSVYDTSLLSISNKILPPNVFYLELSFEDHVVRAKYAVITLKDFRAGTSMRWFHSYLWGRFAQPVSLVYVADEETMNSIHSALAEAVATFAARVVPELRDRFVASELWCEGLLLSYRAELRTEKAGRALMLFEAFSEYYEQLTRAALGAVPFKVNVETSTRPFHYHAELASLVRYRSRFAWTIRRVQGKILSLLRLSKALFTFRGGLDYIAWKLERHSGVTIEITPRVRRHPLLLGWGLMWRLYRRGVFR